MIATIIIILLILSPFCNGITYLFVSKFPMNPYCKFAKFKDIQNKEEYQYKNKQAGILYCVLGFIVSVFLIFICYLNNFFIETNIVFRIFAFYFIIFLIETTLFDTVLDVKFQFKNFEENDEKKE